MRVCVNRAWWCGVAGNQTCCCYCCCIRNPDTGPNTAAAPTFVGWCSCVNHIQNLPSGPGGLSSSSVSAAGATKNPRPIFANTSAVTEEDRRRLEPARRRPAPLLAPLLARERVLDRERALSDVGVLASDGGPPWPWRW